MSSLMMVQVFAFRGSPDVSRQERNARRVEQEPNHGKRILHRFLIQVKGMKKILEGHVLERVLYANVDVCERVHCY